MTWLTRADGAAVELAKTYAVTIDAVLEAGDPEKVAKAMYVGPYLVKILGDLGGTPHGRLILEVKETDGGNKLAAVRNLRETKRPGKRQSRTA